MRTLNYLGLFLFIGCAIKNNPKENSFTQSCNIVEIKEFDYSFRFKAIKKSGDTILIISLKDKFYTKYKIITPIGNELQKIERNKEYNFKSVQIKPRVSTMEQLGAFIIIEKDTLWKAQSYKDIPPSYKSVNTIGSFIIKD